MLLSQAKGEQEPLKSNSRPRASERVEESNGKHDTHRITTRHQCLRAQAAGGTSCAFAMRFSNRPRNWKSRPSNERTNRPTSPPPYAKSNVGATNCFIHRGGQQDETQNNGRTCTIDAHPAPPKHAAVSPAEKSLGPGNTLTPSCPSTAPPAMLSSSENATSQGSAGDDLPRPRRSPREGAPATAAGRPGAGDGCEGMEGGVFPGRVSAGGAPAGTFSRARRTVRRVTSFGGTPSSRIAWGRKEEEEEEARRQQQQRWALFVGNAAPATPAAKNRSTHLGLPADSDHDNISRGGEGLFRVLPRAPPPPSPEGFFTQVGGDH